MDLKEYRQFIDEDMLVVMGQMDYASKILDYLYLVSHCLFVCILNCLSYM